MREQFALKYLFLAAQMPRSSYYELQARSMKPPKNAIELAELRRICEQNHGRYGYRRATVAMRQIGFPINHKRVRRLMVQAGLSCKLRMKKYKTHKGLETKISPNLLKQNFKTAAMNQKWGTDVTEFVMFGRKWMLSVVMDLFNREVIGYMIGNRQTYELIIGPLKKLFESAGDISGLTLHSDQGWCYRLMKYCRMLKKYGVRQSMSRKGNCYDNAVVENFFGILKTEWLSNNHFANEQEMLQQLDKYIDYYNNCRIKCGFGGLSPVQFRLQAGLWTH